MIDSKKKDYGEVAKKASKLLKDGIGIAQILNITNLERRKLRDIKHRDK